MFFRKRLNRSRQIGDLLASFIRANSVNPNMEGKHRSETSIIVHRQENIMTTTVLKLVRIAGLLTITFVPAISAVAQFTISIPKIPKIKKEKPQTTGELPKTTATTSSGGSSSSLPSENRGKPIPGAKITFSTTPDSGASSTNFKSSDFIYGRLDLGGQTIYDAFGLKGLGTRDFYHIKYSIDITQDGKPWEHNWHNRGSIVLVTKDDAKKTFLNFDVVPDPAKLTTIVCTLDDNIDYCKFPGGIYNQTSSVDAASSTFPKDGNYYVDITLWMPGFDGWGKVVEGYENYPAVVGKFTYQFSTQDGQTLVANSKKASSSAEKAKNTKDMLHAMPDWWFKGATPPEPKLAAVRLVPLIKGFIGQWNLTYLKHMIVKSEGPLWVIEKNSLGIPEYRMVKPYIYIAYKDPKENSCNLGALYMRESYAGAGTYGAPYLGGIRDIQYIDCAAVK